MNTPANLEPLPEDWERALAVVAHPDDLEYGAASAIARWTPQGKSVAYALVASGEAGIDSITPEEAGPLREQEERDSAAIVGVDQVEFLGHPDGMIEQDLKLREDITRTIRRHQPELIVTLNHHRFWPGGVALNMADHRAVGATVLDAVRDAGNRWVFRESRDDGLEPWNSVRFVCVHASPHTTHAVDVTDFLDKGIASLEAHRAYIDGLSGEFDAREFLTSSASSVGERAGCKYAVDFEVYRL